MVAISRSTQRPIILLSITADGARKSVRGELERRYAAHYLIASTQTAARACEVLSEAAHRGEQVALFWPTTRRPSMGTRRSSRRPDVSSPT